MFHHLSQGHTHQFRLIGPIDCTFMLEKHAAATFEGLIVLLAFELFLDSRVDVLLPKTGLQILDLPFDFEVVPQGFAYSRLELGRGWHHLCAVMQLEELSVRCELRADILLEVVYAMSVEMCGLSHPQPRQFL